MAHRFTTVSRKYLISKVSSAILSGFKKRAVEADFTIVYDCHMIFLTRVIMMDNPNQIP